MTPITMADFFPAPQITMDDFSPVVTKKPRQTRPTIRTELWGFSGTAIVRALGFAGVTSAKDADVALRSLGLVLNIATIKIQLKAGSKGLRGTPAPLNDEQLDILCEALPKMQAA